MLRSSEEAKRQDLFAAHHRAAGAGARVLLVLAGEMGYVAACSLPSL